MESEAKFPLLDTLSIPRCFRNFCILTPKGVKHPAGLTQLEDLLSTFPDIIPITAAEIRTAMRLMGETRSLSPRDAIHAAVVITHGLEGIVSADQDFDRIPGLRRFDPMEAAAG